MVKLCVVIALFTFGPAVLGARIKNNARSDSGDVTARDSFHIENSTFTDGRALLSARKEGLKGSTVKLVIGGDRTCQKKKFPDAGEVYRAVYNKRIRCGYVGGQEVCEECSGKSNCWYGDGGTCDGSLDKSPMRLKVNSYKYSRYINRAYVCQGGKEKVTLKMKDLQAKNGNLKFFFNGQQIHSGTGEKDKEWKNGGGSGPNEFVIEFTPSRSRAKATVGEAFFEFDSDSVSCKENGDSCFLELTGDSDLNTYNSKKLECLNTNQGTACQKWRRCHGAANIAWMKALLEAGQLQGSSLLQTSNASADSSLATADSATCFDPNTQNVDDINCHNCKQTWLATCASKCPTTPLSDCMRAVACGDDLVCNSWKNSACTAVTTCGSALSLLEVGPTKGEHASFIARRGSIATQNAASVLEESSSSKLDESLTDKCGG